MSPNEREDLRADVAAGVVAGARQVGRLMWRPVRQFLVGILIVLGVAIVLSFMIWAYNYAR